MWECEVVAAARRKDIDIRQKSSDKYRRPASEEYEDTDLLYKVINVYRE